MPESQSVAQSGPGAGLLVLGVDACGPSGTVALARIERGMPPYLRKDGTHEDENATILGQKELAGRTYSATLVAAVSDLLTEKGVKLANLGAIVVVNGPGSFTGVRVGLSAVKGLAEPGQIPVVAVSRLAVLAAKTRVDSAALDAHRHEVFLRLMEADGCSRELLAGAEELTAVELRPVRVAVCDDVAPALLESVWKGAEFVRSEVPTAADAIQLCMPRILAGDFADLASLDGHYLRRSDAEIFGEATKAAVKSSGEINVRQMTAADLERVMEMAACTDHAPLWSRQAYETALDPDAQLGRVALIAEDNRSGAVAGFVVARITPPEAELESIVTAAPHQRRGVARTLFSVLQGHLRGHGASAVVLEVRVGNREAQGFYRFLGFAEEGRRPGYYADPVEDAVLMRLRLH
ncbi:MAG: tRNA (adenosine(37)-N6)-threonylcarbamoyltransferase complex dimerization subunit type 1 TsaB [Terracidiphilus sp.]